MKLHSFNISSSQAQLQQKLREREAESLKREQALEARVRTLEAAGKAFPRISFHMSERWRHTRTRAHAHFTHAHTQA